MPSPIERYKAQAPFTLDNEFLKGLEHGAVNPLNEEPFSAGYRDLVATRQDSIMYRERARFLAEFQKPETRIMLVHADTGVGKSTELAIATLFAANPYKLSGKKIAITQPRQQATRSLGQRVATLLDVPCGEKIGFQVRGTKKTTKDTHLVYMTEGVLVQQLKDDPEMQRYSVIILDEAHERTIDVDIIMSRLNVALAANDKLKVVIMSATLDVPRFREKFPLAGDVFRLAGKQFPVEMLYRPISVAEELLVDQAAELVMDIVTREAPGAILVFLPGIGPIKALEKKIQQRQAGMGIGRGTLKIIKLTSRILANESLDLKTPAPLPESSTDAHGRVIILATNVAETSLTFSDLGYVIDSGLTRTVVHDPVAGCDYEYVVPASQSQVNQRAGRAGRTRPGKCYRLFTHEEYTAMSPHAIPSILQGSMESTILTILALGGEPFTFDYFESPSPVTIASAINSLCAFSGMIQKDPGAGGGVALGQRGVVLRSFAEKPHHLMALVEGCRFECGSDIADIIALDSAIQNRDLFTGPAEEVERWQRNWSHNTGYHNTLLNIMQQFQRRLDGDFDEEKWCKASCLAVNTLRLAVQQKRRLVKQMEDAEMKVVRLPRDTPEYASYILQVLCRAYFQRVSVRMPVGGTYETVRGQIKGELDFSVVKEKAQPFMRDFVISERTVRKGGDKARLSGWSLIKPEWLFKTKLMLKYFDLESMPRGSMLNKFAETLSRMSGTPADQLIGRRPPPPNLE